MGWWSTPRLGTSFACPSSEVEDELPDLGEDEEQDEEVELVLWAADVDSAYTRMFFETRFVRWMTAQLVEGQIVIFYLAGIFGRTDWDASSVHSDHKSAGVRVRADAARKVQ